MPIQTAIPETRTISAKISNAMPRMWLPVRGGGGGTGGRGGCGVVNMEGTSLASCFCNELRAQPPPSSPHQINPLGLSRLGEQVFFPLFPDRCPSSPDADTRIRP